MSYLKCLFDHFIVDEEEEGDMIRGVSFGMTTQQEEEVHSITRGSGWGWGSGWGG